ncbi:MULTISPECIES: sodium/proline symporter PutP [Idiomarina]|uniref:Sodium/proline symporter n=1 Tax=Idiomarina abyssalis TaxID=86102 RepID=A0A8I1KF44_9GAMM|nr:MULTISPECIES: sodium/proline symporter PutP [Idiomarina]MAB21022.1 sodium/proline symporter PutP [Idiomarina sp.]MBH95432.1 sodium/proline symporter PutP [Idiomarina sp.]MBJ7267058.1 sodium/proline symporter PutP [Idiomarina abyssalis]MBJ7274534.1 sodium/proline symporter PutP [Idiomarina abyssalis]MBJ7316591.1 sodium/proline symporter PutP [Idiomarina abyssalis]
METGTLISLALYFIVMLGIGLYAYKKSTDSVSGYMLGGRGLGPGVTALSAGASDMSGWMLMGLPGAIYVSGVSQLWIAVGLVIGAYLNYVIVAPRLRTYTEVANDSITIPDYFANRFNDKGRRLRIFSSVVIIIFFTLYTSASLVAGGKLFDSSFGMDYTTGLWVTAGVVCAYTLFGGFLAVSMTDFVQGCIMFVALVLVPIVAFSELGGYSSVVGQVGDINPDFLAFFKDGATGEMLGTLGIISLLAWGLGYFGQPHIIVRFMAIRSVSDVKAARRIGISWMTVSIIGAMATGFVGIAYVAETKMSLPDAETIFIIFSQFLFHPLIGGFLLAAILAAIMSTISSQLLVSSSSLTEDFYKAFLRKDASDKELVFVGRMSVLAVSLVAIWLAWNPENTILSLVSNAWAGFGAAFGPVVILSLFWKRMNRNGALAGMLAGAITVLFWIYGPTFGGEHLSAYVYEIVPGFILSTLAIIIFSKFTAEPEQELQDKFVEMESVIDDYYHGDKKG